MEVPTKRDEPFDSPPAPARSGQAVSTPVTARASRADIDVRVSVLTDRQDEEEKEAGYGHGV